MTDNALDFIVRPELNALSAYHAGLDTTKIRLDANESPFPHTLKALGQNSLSTIELNRYPDPDATELKQALAQMYRCEPQELILGCGSDEVIAMLLTALSNTPKGRTKPMIMVPAPTFVMYGVTATAHGFAVHTLDLDKDWQLTLDSWLAAIEREQPNLIFLASPNNPTGCIYPEAVLETLLLNAPRTLVVLDEAYVAFSEGSLSYLCEGYKNLAVLGTLSKVGFAALRVGWGRLPVALAHEVNKVRQPYNLNTISQVLAREVLTTHRELWNTEVQQIVAERKRVAQALSKLSGVTVVPSQANFLLIEVAQAQTLHVDLLDSGISVRRFTNNPRLSSHLRVTIGLPTENDKFLETFSQLLKR